MKKKIIVLDANQNNSGELSSILNSKNYPFTHVQTMSSLEDLFESNQYFAIIIDIDLIPIDNRTIRDLTIKYPNVLFLCTSKDRFHPELKDAFCYHIYACLNKPVDPEELFYLLKDIYENESVSNDLP